MTTRPEPSRDIARLLELMAALRTPGTGCPWDLDQDFATIAPYTIEEAYEVADAIARGDFVDLTDELGDLLLQVAFHARMAEEIGRFDFGDVVQAITAKLIRRHPHVFGDAGGLGTEAVNAQWAAIKAEEKAAKARAKDGQSSSEAGENARPARTLEGIPLALPALTRAIKLQDKAARVGFDWGAVGPVIAKIKEEIAEMEAEIAADDRTAAASEIGDVLFAVVNLARHLGVDPEDALRQTNHKFTRRFAAIEDALARDGRTPEQSNLDEMDALWNAAKAAERRG
jgi:ATP diphosphatase